ncbi:MAG: hypothetical protein PHG04_00635 [Candidatus Nanoarchaeia archaeon]|nr:hypothetical protein [Candidatus Nanoarchaeia archaeon]MDD5053871.1 hypothetical protein [Candidatus Nanoarchaeia archaeon]
MGDVVRVQVNVSELIISAKELVDFILKNLKEMDYTAKLKSYKYQMGKNPGEITQVQFMIFADKPVDDYTSFIVNCEFTTDNAKIEKKGKKSIISGESKLIFTSFAKTDYEDRWKNNSFLHFLRKIYEKYIYNDRLINFEDIAEKELFDLVESVKSKIQVK